MNESHAPLKKVKTQTVTTTAKTAEPSPYDLLEPVEEKVLRMRFGLSEDDSKTLEYAVGASQDTKDRVTLMEAANIVDLDGNVPVAEGMDKEDLYRAVQHIDFESVL